MAEILSFTHADGGIIESDEPAYIVLAALREECIWMLPDPEVKDYVRREGDDMDRLPHGMPRMFP